MIQQKSVRCWSIPCRADSGCGGRQDSTGNKGTIFPPRNIVHLVRGICLHLADRMYSAREGVFVPRLKLRSLVP
jgi:hypothetical protein